MGQSRLPIVSKPSHRTDRKGNTHHPLKLSNFVLSLLPPQKPLAFPSRLDEVRTLLHPRPQRDRDIRKARGVLALKLTHPRVRGLDAEVLDVGKLRTGGRLVDDEMLGAFEIGGVALVNHADAEAVRVEVEKAKIDVLQGLVVAHQRLDELRVRLEQLFRNEGVDHALEHHAPFSRVGSCVRCSQKDDPESRDKDRAKVVIVIALEVERQLEGSLDEDPS